MSKPRIVICGAGVGGLTSAIALRARGFDVVVFEQAERFARVGADLNLTPNAVKAIDGIGEGIGEAMRRSAARPTHRISRTWDTGEVTSIIEMADEAQRKYGAPQLTIHRGDCLKALEAALPAGVIRLSKRAVALEQSTGRVNVAFTDGSSAQVDALIGADGIHSVVCRELFGPESPEFTGLVSYRAIVPRARLSIPNLDAFTKWWGPDPSMQIVVFPLLRGEEIFVFATTAQDDWREESWTLPGDVEELRRVYAGFHPEARALLEACTEVTKSALYVRQPMPVWSYGRVTLLGDAAHPMVPFMAQGACMAVEDAVVLARALEGCDGPGLPGALQRYERARKERTARVQLGSRGNEWLKQGGNADWVYGYDAWAVNLD